MTWGEHDPAIKALSEENARLKAENERMREALEQIIADLSWDGVPHIDAGEMQHRANLAIFAARAALAGEGE